MSHCEVSISAETACDEEASRPEQGCYVFNYTITMENTGDETVTLRTRHWFITDANGDVAEVKGDGVVGEFPTIRPHQKYSYSSYSVLPTPVGTMHGQYHMIKDSGDPYVVDIPVFRLSNEQWLH